MLGLKPIKLLPARERVASALRKAIISKSIPEGAELTLENTAQELGVSVTPVREAFQILARDGLLEVKQNKCAIVLGVTEKTIREHYQLRAALEGTACMLCCQNNADLSKIKNCVDTAEEALSLQQAGNYTDYNQSFHFEIWEASGNEKMRNLLSELWNGLSIGVEMSELDYALNSQSEHKKIYAALEARDAMAARAEMEKAHPAQHGRCADLLFIRSGRTRQCIPVRTVRFWPAPTTSRKRCPKTAPCGMLR